MAAGFAAGQEEEGFEVSARSFVIMDAKTGKILLALNPQLFFASGQHPQGYDRLSVVEHLKMDDKVSVSAYAAAARRPRSASNRERLTRCRSCSMPSCCRQPTTLPGPGGKVCGSEPAFAHQVTQEVRQWGAYRTTCATANGLPADNQYSTAQTWP